MLKPLLHRVYARYQYPSGVKAVYDNGGKTADRYTVVYTEYRMANGIRLYDCYALSGSPFHAFGIAQHSDCALGAHLGRRIPFEALPEACQGLVMQDLAYSNKEDGT